MSELKLLVAEAGQPGVLRRAGARGRELCERGLTTVEYAIGIVLVLTIVALVIKVVGDAWFAEAVKGVISAVFDIIKEKIGG